MKTLLGLLLLLVCICPIKAQSESTPQNDPMQNQNATLLTFDRVEFMSPGHTPSSTAVASPAPMKSTHNFKTRTRLWIASSLAVYIAAALDMRATEQAAQIYKKTPSYFYGYFETDPLAKPFVTLPAPAYYACGIAFATGINWVGFRMSRSHRFRKAWWLPQTLSVLGNTHGYRTHLD